MKYFLQSDLNQQSHMGMLYRTLDSPFVKILVVVFSLKLGEHHSNVVCQQFIADEGSNCYGDLGFA